jgi:hypothetical protein
MKTDDIFLAVERVAKKRGTLTWEIQAAVTSTSCVVAVCKRARVRADGETRKRVAGFVAHRLHRLDLILPQGGWLRFSHGTNGRTRIGYRLGGLSGGTSVEGELRLEREAARACCRQLRRLF